MSTVNDSARVRQAQACRELQSVCEPHSLGRPDPKKPYLCIMRDDYTHWPCMLGEKMVMTGYTNQWDGFRFLCFNLGICRECFRGLAVS